MSAPWYPPTPIDNIFDQLKCCTKFASESRDPITSTATILTGALVIEENHLFPIASNEWRAKAAHQRTMAVCNAHFRQAYKEYRHKATTA